MGSPGVRLGVGILVVLAPVWPAAAQPHHYEDSLRGGTTGNASGGSFGPDGWTITFCSGL